jgi:hypothetical protein
MVGNVGVYPVAKFAGWIESELLECSTDLELHGAVAFAAGLPAGETDAHHVGVNLVNDALDDLRRHLGPVLLEDLSKRANALVRSSD